MDYEFEEKKYSSGSQTQPTQGKTTQPVTSPLYTYCVFREPEKRVLGQQCHHLMGEFSIFFWRHVNAKRKQKTVLQNSPDKQCFGFRDSLDLRHLHSGRLWMNLITFLQLYQKHCCRQKSPNCLHLIILEADLHSLVLKRGKNC